jgi:hypothetical protein
VTNAKHTTLHVLTQYAWPDDAPTGLYATQVAEAVAATGRNVVVVASEGAYRPARRPPPAVTIVRVGHGEGRRGASLRTLAEYRSVTSAFGRYIRARVHRGDTVLVVSAPPDTPWLLSDIRSRGARAIYWLQDFFPELIRSVSDPPRPLRALFSEVFRRQLAGWDLVVKISENLGYDGLNARVIRNWPTLDLGPPRAAVARTALYSGNLGYGHHLGLFVERCRELTDEGFTVTVRADGPGVARLPSWLAPSPLFANLDELKRSYWESEVHLVAAHPNIERAFFPSKVWNSLAAGRRIVLSGFGPRMRRELEVAQTADFGGHLAQWVRLLCGTDAL